MTKRLAATRTRALQAVRNYEYRRRVVQETMLRAVAEAREKVRTALVEWSRLADATDEELSRWAEALGYDPEAPSHEDHALDPTPLISDEYENFAERLEDPEVADEVMRSIMDEEQSPFPAEPNEWTADEAIAVIEQTEPWSEPED